MLASSTPSPPTPSGETAVNGRLRSRRGAATAVAHAARTLDDTLPTFGQGPRRTARNQQAGVGACR